MFVRELTAALDHIKGVGQSSEKALANVGVTNIAGLLLYYPRDWEDRSKNIPLKEFQNRTICSTVRVLAHSWFGFGSMKTLKIFIEDETATAALVCFNRPFMEKQLIPGKLYRIYGNFFYKYGEIQSSSFEFESVDNENISTSFGHILPIYPLTAGLTQNMMRKFIRFALKQYAQNLEDELPESIKLKKNLLKKTEALSAIHFPRNIETLNNARKTLIYEELFYLEVIVARRSLLRKNVSKNSKTKSELNSLQEHLLERLSFDLTKGQREALDDINCDMESSYPMARLLQGDVGSGKTLVSFLAALKAIGNGAQAAIMAPTELLARQHAENAAKLLEPLGVRAAFLTGNIKTAGRNNLLKALSQGEIDLVLGTHALFSKNVIYKNLRLVVIDEQHRFGVTQRQAILAKGERCDLLMMSATPIPRTLALTIFGDMDVSVIRDLPPGRKPVITHLAKESNIRKVYDFVKDHLDKGRQAYLVYPLIESLSNPDGSESDEKKLRDATSMMEKISRTPAALIHSKISDDEKKIIIEKFRMGEIKLLVATSVVEVGVDVPNANCMVIHHAERFGLSALHQLRGRVGRGHEQSYCFLIYSDELTDDGKQRLKVMLENSDGFVIAEEDLKLRGPGQIVGVEQSGYLRLGIADPVRDSAELENARSGAFAILENDPDLSLTENLVIREALRRAPPFSYAGL
ncbi:ATP-dependent DNA helicase RecG [Spirochaetia bacterium]|nr:ATP-dependent DNA helicase RecG [Spirochaetia bacterium]